MTSRTPKARHQRFLAAGFFPPEMRPAFTLPRSRQNLRFLTARSVRSLQRRTVRPPIIIINLNALDGGPTVRFQKDPGRSLYRDFIILDELGYLPFSQSGGQLLFHLTSRIYGLGFGFANDFLASSGWRKPPLTLIMRKTVIQPCDIIFNISSPAASA
jgi:hypothetical protein